MRDWNSRVAQVTGGSNPPLSARARLKPRGRCLLRRICGVATDSKRGFQRSRPKACRVPTDGTQQSIRVEHLRKATPCSWPNARASVSCCCALSGWCCWDCAESEPDETWSLVMRKIGQAYVTHVSCAKLSEPQTGAAKRLLHKVGVSDHRLLVASSRPRSLGDFLLADLRSSRIHSGCATLLFAFLLAGDSQLQPRGSRRIARGSRCDTERLRARLR